MQLAVAIAEENEDHIQAAVAWALGQIGRHTPEHAKAVASSNVLPKLLACYLRADAAEDLQTKVQFKNWDDTVGIYEKAIRSVVSTISQ